MNFRLATTIATIIAVSELLISCAGISATAPGVIYKPGPQVTVPIAIPCAIDAGPSPHYPDTTQALASAPNIFERAKLVMAGRALRIARELILTADNEGCRPPAAH
jgi:hypothetical protein